MALARSGRNSKTHKSVQLIPMDDFGRPLDAQGRVLPVNEFGQFLLAEKDQSLATISYEEGPSLGPDVQRQRIFVDGMGQRRRNNTRHCFVSGFIELLLMLAN